MHKVIIFIALFALNFTAATAQANMSEKDRELISRIASGNAEDVRILLEGNADPNAKNSLGRPAIVIAAESTQASSVKILALLANAGAQPTSADSLGNNAITAAISRGSAESVAYLLQWKPSYKMQDGYGDDLSAIAKDRGDQEIIELVRQLKQAEDDKHIRNTSSQNRQRLFREYSFRNCAEEYMTFYYNNEHEADPDLGKHDAIMLRLAKEITETLAELEKHFSLGRVEMDSVKDASRKSISQQLADMGSSRHRVRKGVGTNADLQKRCGKISTDVSLRTAIRRK